MVVQTPHFCCFMSLTSPIFISLLG
jgi:hypothetical protein